MWPNDAAMLVPGVISKRQILCVRVARVAAVSALAAVWMV